MHIYAHVHVNACKYIAYTYAHVCIIMHVKLYVGRSVCTIYIPIPKGHYHQV